MFSLISSLVSLCFCVQFSHATILPLTRRAAANSSIPLLATTYGSQYNVEVGIGNQSYILQLDTGSADVWVVSPDFICLDADTLEPQKQSTCNYGPKMWQQSPTFQVNTDEVLAAQYGAGNVIGVMGNDTVSVGGIAVQNQAIGIANMSINHGDGQCVGIFGLGFPWDTSAHPADFNYTNTSFLEDKITYQPFLLNAIGLGLLAEPYISIAIERTEANQSVSATAGFLGLGSLPDISYNSSFTSAPNEILQVIPTSLTGGSSVLTLWTLTVNATTTAGISNMTSFQATPDTGNNFNAYPRDLAASINAKWSPPATLISDSTSNQDTYSVDCDATPPNHGVTVGNQTFFLDPRDMIIQTGDGCVSAISGILPADDGISLYFLGDAFFKNVLAVFDYGKNEMRFASRSNSSSSSLSGQPASPKSAAPGQIAHSSSWALIISTLLGLLVIVS